MIQITGRSNYQDFMEWYNRKNPENPKDFIENPDLLLEDKYGIQAAFWFWDVRDLNSLSHGGTDADVLVVTKKINGGSTGIKHRTKLFNRIYKILNEKEQKN